MTILERGKLGTVELDNFNLFTFISPNVWIYLDCGIKKGKSVIRSHFPKTVTNQMMCDQLNCWPNLRNFSFYIVLTIDCQLLNRMYRIHIYTLLWGLKLKLSLEDDEVCPAVICLHITCFIGCKPWAVYGLISKAMQSDMRQTEPIRGQAVTHWPIRSQGNWETENWL